MVAEPGARFRPVACRDFAGRQAPGPWIDIEALVELDAVLAERREDAEIGEDEESDDAFDGELVVLAGAYAGEAIRAQVGGRWHYDPETELMNPIHLVVEGSKINVLGKVGKFLRSGPGDSVESLAQVVVQMTRETRGT